MKKITIEIDGVTYVKEGSKSAKKKKNMEYKIVRTYSAGVFAGYIESRNGREVVLRDARRLWYWARCGIIVPVGYNRYI